MNEPDLLKHILASIPGVKLVDYQECVSLPGARSFDCQYNTSSDRRLGESTKLEFPKAQHPSVYIMISDTAKEGAATVGIRKAVEEFRSIINRDNIEGYYPLHGISPGFSIFYLPITIDGVPVRVVMSYCSREQGILTSFDSYYEPKL